MTAWRPNGRSPRMVGNVVWLPLTSATAESHERTLVAAPTLHPTGRFKSSRGSRRYAYPADSSSDRGVCAAAGRGTSIKDATVSASVSAIRCGRRAGACMALSCQNQFSSSCLRTFVSSCEMSPRATGSCVALFVVVAFVARPAFAQTSAYGMNVQLDIHAQAAPVADKLKELGAGVLRMPFGWDVIEPSCKGCFDWT